MRETEKQRREKSVKLVRPRWFSQQCRMCGDSIKQELLFKYYGTYYCTRCCPQKVDAMKHIFKDYE